MWNMRDDFETAHVRELFLPTLKSTAIFTSVVLTLGSGWVAVEAAKRDAAIPVFLITLNLLHCLIVVTLFRVPRDSPNTHRMT